MGKPTKLTPEIQTKVAGYVNAGAPIPMACTAAGLSWNTAKEWLARGRRGEQPYDEFVAAMAEAKARWVAGSTMRITKASQKDWKAAAWLLERRAPKHFAPKVIAERTQAPRDVPDPSASAPLEDAIQAMLDARKAGKL